MNLYELDNRTRQFLHSDTFLEDLTATEFIEEVSKQHEISLNEKTNNLEQLDPKPFIRTFESVLNELKFLQKKNLDKMNEIENEIIDYETYHSKKIIDLSNQISLINNNFNSLDNVISNVGTIINPLGENLKIATNLKEKNFEIIFLLKCYNEFLKYDQSKLLIDLQNSKKINDKKQCGKFISKLLKLSKKLNNNDIFQKIDNFAQNFETKLLEEFDQSFESENSLKMKECFDILIDFNENNLEIYDKYLNKITINFNEEDYLLNQEFLNENNEFWQLISNPINHFNTKELNSVCPEFNDLLNNYENLIKNQFNNLKIIFNKSKSYFLKIIELFFKKIFQEKLNNIFINLLNYSQSINNLSYVRILHYLYLNLLIIINNLKKFFEINYSKIYFEDLLNDSNDNDLINLIENNFNELFFEFLNEKNYIEKEKKSLEEIYLNINNNFEKKHPKIFKVKALSVRLATTDSIKESNLLSPITSPTLSSKFGSFTLNNNNSNNNNNNFEKNRLIQLRTYMKSKLERSSSQSSKFSSLNDSLLLSPKVDQINNIFSETKEELNDDIDDDIKFTKIDFMLQNSVESLSRISDLKSSNIPENSLEILRILIFGISTYLEFGFEINYYKLIHFDYKKNEFLNLNYLKIINKLNKILKLLTDFIKLIILPLSINNLNFKKKIINLTNGYLTTCELSLNIILKDSIELIINKIQFYLDKQKKKDFSINNKKDLLVNESDDEEINDEKTETCQNICKFLNDLHNEELIKKKLLINSNLINFLIEIGINLLNLLIQHFKKFTITEIGGIILTKDVISYQGLIDSWGIDELSERFSILRELANLFTVQPNYINSLIKEGQLINLNPDIIQQYVGKRSDYNSSFLNKFGSFI